MQFKLAHSHRIFRIRHRFYQQNKVKLRFRLNNVSDYLVIISLVFIYYYII